MKVSQSCPTLCDPMDYRVHAILQATEPLHLFCWGHPQSEGPKPHLFISSSFKSFFNHFSRKEGTANT